MFGSEKIIKALALSGKRLRAPTDAELKRMQKLMLGAYRDLERVCLAHGLTLMLGGGSALGAAREKGFIPWDDDMDLMMPRADYEALKKLFDGALGDKYALTAPNAPGHKAINLYMKLEIRGTVRREIQSLGAPGLNAVCIDVFPLDYAPDNALLRALKGAFIDALAALAVSCRLWKYRNAALRAFMCQSASGRFNYRFRMLLGLIAAPIGYEKLYDFFDKAARGRRATGYLTVPAGIRHYGGEAQPARVFVPVSEGVFEGERARLPGDARAYLERRYGDYMTPPPPDKREKHAYAELDLGEFAGEDDIK